MRRLLRKALNLDIVDGLILMNQQQMVLMERAELESVRNARDIIQRFLWALENDVDQDELADTLRLGLTDLSDHVARLEEHAL